MGEHMRQCSQRVVVKMEYGQQPQSNYEFLEPELKPQNLYDPKQPRNVTRHFVAPKKPEKTKSKTLSCEFCGDQVKIQSLSAHQCYKIATIVKQRVKREIKHEVRTEGGRSSLIEPTSSTVPKQ